MKFSIFLKIPRNHCSDEANAAFDLQYPRILPQIDGNGGATDLNNYVN